LERWARRFRRPVVIQIPPQPIGRIPNINIPPVPEQGPVERERQEGPMALVTNGLRLAEQVLFVFVASLWPNAVGGGGDPIPPALMREVNVPARQQNRRDNLDEEDIDDDNGPENRALNGAERDPAQVVVQ
jgi:hypothetical protein